MKSLQEIMGDAYELACDIAYKNMRSDGTFHEVKEADLFEEGEMDLVWGWAEGLEYKYLEKMVGCRCSFGEMVEWDIKKYEDDCIKAVDALKKILERVGPAVVITDEELAAGGWRV